MSRSYTLVVWKQLYVPNTWLFMSTKPTPVAVICNGIREKVILNTTGIIKIEPHCVIKTKHNTIRAMISSDFLDVQGYNKEIDRPVTKINTDKLPKLSKLELEPVMKTNDHIKTLEDDAQKTSATLDNTYWHRINVHASMVGASTVGSILLIGIICWGLWKLYNKKRQRVLSSDDFILQPIRPSGGGQ